MKLFDCIRFAGCSLALFLTFSITAQNATEATGFLGDNFSLEGALALFEKADSPEDFEKRLNKQQNKVNNLDLNEDGEIDYIRVVDNMEGEAHALVLQVPINATESQDIAVIEIEKEGKESAILQIIGDEEVYGETTIIEPFDTEASEGNGGPDGNFTFTRVVVNVWLWPSVRYVYRPNYRVWVSPYKWRVYPRYWKPWRPLTWAVFHPVHVHHRARFRVVPTHRVVRAHRVYTPVRKTSRVVVTKTTKVRTSRGVAGRKTAVTKTTTRTVATRNGKSKVKASRTNQRGVKKTKNGVVAGKRSTKTVRAKNKQGKRVGVKKTKSTKVKRKRN